MYEMPPILKGSQQEQIAALRDYLARMARRDTTEENAAVVEAVVQRVVPKSSDNTNNLRSLIIKNADNITVAFNDIDDLESRMTSDYVATSDFGTVLLEYSSDIQNLASGVVESYGYEEAIAAKFSQNDADVLVNRVSKVEGYIRRGWIVDPSTNELVLGIAIFQKLDFDMTSTTDLDGNTYYEIINDSNHHPTFGLYTSKGWQFWINGQKVGWFDSEDSMLHVTNIVDESTMWLGAEWQITHVGGFGIKYLGD